MATGSPAGSAPMSAIISCPGGTPPRAKSRQSRHLAPCERLPAARRPVGAGSAGGAALGRLSLWQIERAGLSYVSLRMLARPQACLP